MNVDAASVGSLLLSDSFITIMDVSLSENCFYIAFQLLSVPISHNMKFSIVTHVLVDDFEWIRCSPLWILVLSQ